jgi:hypothetical protein
MRACGRRAEQQAGTEDSARHGQQQTQSGTDAAMVTPASREGHEAGARTPARPDVRLEDHGLDVVTTPPVRSHHDVSFNVGPHDRPAAPSVTDEM